MESAEQRTNPGKLPDRSAVLGSWYNQHGSELVLEQKMRACWHMSIERPSTHAESELWRGTWTGEDEFRRAPFGAHQRTGGSQPLPEWP